MCYQCLQQVQVTDRIYRSLFSNYNLSACPNMSGLHPAGGQHRCQFHQLTMAGIMQFFALPKLWAFWKRPRDDNHNKQFSLARQNFVYYTYADRICQQHDHAFIREYYHEDKFSVLLWR